MKESKKTSLFKKLTTPEGMLVIGFILMFILFSLLYPTFATPRNITKVMKQSASLFMLVCGQTLVLLLAGIDLAQGSAVSFFSIVGALSVLHFGTLPGMIVTLAAGMLYGAVCGGIITRFHVQPYVVSLGMMFLLEGATYLITQTAITGLPESFFYLGGASLFGINISVIVAVAVALCLFYFTRYTSVGRSLYIVGGNENVARLSGVRIVRAKMVAWMLDGTLVALAALMMTSRMQSGQPYMGGGLSNEVLGAAVIGGTSLAGGKGGIPQAFIGVLIMAFMINGLNLMGVSTDVKEVICGCLIVLVALMGARQNAKTN